MNPKLSFILLICAVILLHADAPLRWRACLNGIWDIAYSAEASDEVPGPDAWRPMRVPSSHYTRNWPHAAGITTAKRLWYRLHFQVPSEWQGKEIKLYFEQVAHAHGIWLNGKLLKQRTHWMVCQTLDVTDTVVFDGDNELIVYAERPHHFYYKYCGLFRDVFISAVPKTSIHYTLIKPSVRNHKLDVTVAIEEAQENQTSPVEISAFVQDDGKTVLALPSQTITPVFGKENTVDFSSGWADPILWGYGEYGTPHLYTMRVELRRDGKLIDVKHERFGFREFYAEGDQFMFNGKPIYLTGDLLEFTTDHGDHPAPMREFLQRMRESNINFYRCHNMLMDSSATFEIADEIGLLVQPEMRGMPVNSDGSQLTPDSEATMEAWRNYMIANFNSPSIISWCVNNETFSVGLTSPENLRKIDQKLLGEYDNQISMLHAMDPTRIVEINHNYSVWPFVKMGKMKRSNFEVFNIHPYGNIEAVINTEQELLKFNGEVPVLIGEIFAHNETQIEFLQAPEAAYIEQWRIAQNYYRQIHMAKNARHVCGSVLCAENGTGYIGYSDPDTCILGPWDEFAQIKDENGATTALRYFYVHPHWPSLSGRGVKADFFPGWAVSGGWTGVNYNWFDPTAPVCNFNIVDASVKKAHREVNGGVDLPPFPDVRMPEILAGFGTASKAETSPYAWVSSPNRSGEWDGVLMDQAQTAWFRVFSPGTYTVTAGKFTKTIKIDALPKYTGKAGYDYLTWVDMDGAFDIDAHKLALNQPAKKTVSEITYAGEKVHNGSFEFWSNEGTPVQWSTRVLRNGDGCEGSCSAQIDGSSAYTVQRIQMEKGKTYRIKAAIKKLSGSGCGSIQFTTSNYDLLCKFNASTTVGEWALIDELYTADGSETYFYLRNDYMGDDASVLYDAASIKEEPVEVQEKPLEAGPFTLSANGCIRNWLVVGPFANMENRETGFQAGYTDYLKNYGGEAAYSPKFGDDVSTEFGEGSYWRPGTYTITWNQIHSQNDLIDLSHILLKEAMVCAAPPTNVAAYLYCRIESDDERDIRIGMGSDDGYVLYLNGEKIGSYLKNRGSELDQETYAAHLVKGTNTIMLKAIQDAGGWNVIVHLTAPDSSPLTDLQIILE